MKKELNIAIGLRIKSSREKAGLTQEKLADSIDLSVQFLSDLERGKSGASISTIVNLSRILGVSCDYLLTGCPDPDASDEGISAVFERIRFLSPENQKLLNEHITLMLTGQNLNRD